MKPAHDISRRQVEAGRGSRLGRRAVLGGVAWIPAVLVGACAEGPIAPPDTDFFEGVEPGAEGEVTERHLERRLLAEFAIGSKDDRLVTYLRREGFEIDRRINPGNVANPVLGIATMRFGPLLANVLVEVRWRANARAEITEIQVNYGREL